MANLISQRGSGILTRLPMRPVTGAEVGVWDGRLSRFLLGNRPDLTLYMVDRWSAVPVGHRYRASNSQMAMSPQSTFDEVYAKARETARPYPGAYILKGESVEVARLIEDESLDFVFIDADHSYEAVAEDIAAWLPKVKPDGFLSGHDWDHPDHPSDWGVRRAVEEFAASRELNIELGENRTWFISLTGIAA